MLGTMSKTIGSQNSQQVWLRSCQTWLYGIRGDKRRRTEWQRITKQYWALMKAVTDLCATPPAAMDVEEPQPQPQPLHQPQSQQQQLDDVSVGQVRRV